MERVVSSLDDPSASPCGRCAVCAGNFFASDVYAGLVQEAVEFLRRSNRRIEPRASGRVRELPTARGRYRSNCEAKPGYALSMWGDAGWGRRVAEGKYEHGRFDDELVAACADMIRSAWQPQPAPLGHGRAIASPSDAGSRVCRAPGARRYTCHSFRRFENPARRRRRRRWRIVRSRWRTSRARSRSSRDRSIRGPCLLVDDMVDSRWTFTECAFVLRAAGSGPVFPVALATTAGAGDAS